MAKRNPLSRSIVPSQRKHETPAKLPRNLYERPIKLPRMTPVHEGTRERLRAKGFLADAAE